MYFFANIDFLKNKLENILRNETFQAIYKTLISQCLKITQKVSFFHIYLQIILEKNFPWKFKWDIFGDFSNTVFLWPVAFAKFSHILIFIELNMYF